MTTKIKIENDGTSNGDVVVRAFNSCEGTIAFELLPGEARELWITDNTGLFVTETWPTKKPNPDSPAPAEPGED